MEKNLKQAFKWKTIIKALMKFCAYLFLFCMAVFLWLVVASHFYFESLEMDISEMMSFDAFDDIPRE